MVTHVLYRSPCAPSLRQLVVWRRLPIKPSCLAKHFIERFQSGVILV